MDARPMRSSAAVSAKFAARNKSGSQLGAAFVLRRNLWLVAAFGGTIAGQIGDLLVGHAEILVRIDRDVVDAYFIVKMRPGSAAGLADVADDLPADNVLSGDDGDGRKMAVYGLNIVAVIQDHFAAVACAHGCVQNRPVG